MGHPTINKVIGLGCGVISPGHHDSDARRSAFQHALLETMSEILGKANARPDGIKCYVQDQMYTDVDKSVLTGAGFTVLEDPEAFLEVDDSSVVFSCAPDAPVRQLVAELARPVMMIWNRVAESDGVDRILG